MKKRIWELDAFRGIFILGMVLVHLFYDLIDFYQVTSADSLGIYSFFLNWGGILFFLISGICVTFSGHYLRRGIAVFLFGMLCTAVTSTLVLLDFADPSLTIYFGVLHCLGMCMLLWPLFKKCPVWLLCLLSAAIIALGLYADGHIRVDFPWLVPLGLIPHGFTSSDYFPLFPNLGYFLAGAVLGKTLYARQETLFPQVDPQKPLIRFLLFCGKHSLTIYLLHQPVLIALVGLILHFV